MDEKNKGKKSQAGYKYLLTYKQSGEIYDLTVEFCERFLPGRENLRIYEQMVHAGRSGKQNIAEGYCEESLKSYIYLVGVAKASLVELLEDYRDFARQRGITVWARTTEKDKWVKGMMARQDRTGLPLTPGKPLDPLYPFNYMVNLIPMTTYLLDKQIAGLKKKFIEEGGYTENLFRKRMEYRNRDKRQNREQELKKDEQRIKNIYRKDK
ncbi:four helix bundle suffix domain-containing protein [Patescibacteria group bacterium]|nr:four helix bundle suffix domain-containing protein [Patescibacteria group bacterium]MBU4511947.1 four helix bundle suffix domain-containing protein [Patescibacteria group bacterium]MCG2692704.1 four helix bundle suffix domain-containing protein [Candidatus Parcubacteria bacterium]